MSEKNTENNEIVEKDSVNEPSKIIKPISDKIQYLIGAVSGLLTCGAIMLSSSTIEIKDPLISKVFEYAFLIIFVIFMVGVRKTEEKRNISMSKTRKAYMIAMGVGIVIFAINAFMSGSLSFGK